MMNKHLAESPVVPLQPANCTVTTAITASAR